MNLHDPNPMEHFQEWFYETKNNFSDDEVNAMHLTTIGLDTYPKSRVVLLKSYNWEGFSFYTNYESEKGISIAANPKVQLLFNWKKSGKIVRIEGYAKKITKESSENYFHSRPRGSQLGAWVSRQSRKISNRRFLTEQLALLEKKYHNKEIPMPPYWGGYLVEPTQFEFFNRAFGNLENRVIYQLKDDYQWNIKEKLELNDNY